MYLPTTFLIVRQKEQLQILRIIPDKRDNIENIFLKIHYFLHQKKIYIFKRRLTILRNNNRIIFSPSYSSSVKKFPDNYTINFIASWWKSSSPIISSFKFNYSTLMFCSRVRKISFSFILNVSINLLMDIIFELFCY